MAFNFVCWLPGSCAPLRRDSFLLMLWMLGIVTVLSREIERETKRQREMKPVSGSYFESVRLPVFV